MVAFYNEADNLLYKQPNSQFITQDRFRGDVAPNPEEIEEVTETFGIPATTVFQNNGGGNGGGGNFNSSISNSPYMAQTGYKTFRTDRPGDYLSYLPGKEPEETFMDKTGGLIKKGIGMAIPGGNFLLGLAENQSRENRLSGTDNAFIDMQLANQEQSLHGGNSTTQDRYGYNKESLFGNYSNVVEKQLAKMEKRKAKAKEEGTVFEELDIDKYYLEKQKEEEDVKNQIEVNNFIRQRGIANKIREGIKKGTIKEDFNVHGGDGKNDITTGAATTNDKAPDNINTYQGPTTYDFNEGDHRRSGGNRQDTPSGHTNPGKGSYGPWMAKGGRVGYFFGGLAARGMKR